MWCFQCEVGECIPRENKIHTIEMIYISLEYVVGIIFTTKTKKESKIVTYTTSLGKPYSRMNACLRQKRL